MKRITATLAVILILSLSACSVKPAELMEFTSAGQDGSFALLWEDRVYRPFCVVDKKDCGELLGYVDGDTGWHVCQYKDLPIDKWIADYLTVDGGAMLWMEDGVSQIPEGLEREYK